jgi:hypothetical protein
MRQFQVLKDFAQMASWYDARGLAIPRPDMLPKFGLIEDNVAAAFLYLTDSSIVLLDALITNPAADYQKRQVAIVEIITGLEAAASIAGAKHIVCYTKTETITHRLKRDLGYMVSEQPQEWLATKGIN